MWSRWGRSKQSFWPIPGFVFGWPWEAWPFDYYGPLVVVPNQFQRIHTAQIFFLDSRLFRHELADPKSVHAAANRVERKKARYFQRKVEISSCMHAPCMLTCSSPACVTFLFHPADPRREVYRDFQPSFTYSTGPVSRIVQITGSVHPPAYTVQSLTLHQHRDNARMANQIQPTISSSAQKHLNSFPSKC